MRVLIALTLTLTACVPLASKVMDNEFSVTSSSPDGGYEIRSIEVSGAEISERNRITLTPTFGASGGAEIVSHSWYFSSTSLEGAAESEFQMRNETNYAASFMAPEARAPYEVVLELVIFDSQNRATTAMKTIEVNASNDPMQVTILQTPATGQERELVQLSAQITDSEGDEPTAYQWSITGVSGNQVNVNQITLSDPNAPNPTFNAPEARDPYDIQVSLSAADVSGATTTQSGTASVNAVNDPPTIGGVDFTVVGNEGAAFPSEGDTIVLSAMTSDLDSPSLGFNWSVVSVTGNEVNPGDINISNPQAETPTVTMPMAGASYTVAFQLSLNDEDNATSTTTNVLVIADDSDQPPSITDIRLSNANPSEGNTVQLIPTISNPGNVQINRYEWAVVQASGGNVTINDFNLSNPNTQSPSFTVPEGTANFNATFRLTIGTRTFPDITENAVFNFTANNDPPSITQLAVVEQNPSEGQVVHLVSDATDPEDQNIFFSWTVLPFNMGGVDQNDVNLSATNIPNPEFLAPDAESDYTVPLRLTISDGVNQNISQNLNVQITAESDYNFVGCEPGSTPLTGAQLQAKFEETFHLAFSAKCAGCHGGAFIPIVNPSIPIAYPEAKERFTNMNVVESSLLYLKATNQVSHNCNDNICNLEDNGILARDSLNAWGSCEVIANDNGGGNNNGDEVTLAAIPIPSNIPMGGSNFSTLTFPLSGVNGINGGFLRIDIQRFNTNYYLVKNYRIQAQGQSIRARKGKLYINGSEDSTITGIRGINRVVAGGSTRSLGYRDANMPSLSQIGNFGSDSISLGFEVLEPE